MPRFGCSLPAKLNVFNQSCSHICCLKTTLQPQLAPFLLHITQRALFILTCVLPTACSTNIRFVKLYNHDGSIRGQPSRCLCVVSQIFPRSLPTCQTFIPTILSAVNKETLNYIKANLNSFSFIVVAQVLESLPPILRLLAPWPKPSTEKTSNWYMEAAPAGLWAR